MARIVSRCVRWAAPLGGALLLIFGFAPLATGQGQRPSKPVAAPEVPATYQLACGLRATVQGPELLLTNSAGTVVARNSHLIRQEDEHTLCPSAGFEQIIAKGDYFTIEQQTCGGWFFINEYITFRYVKASGSIVLHKYGRVFIDRRDPNKAIPAEVYTAKQLGPRLFAQVTKVSLDAVGH